MSYYYGQRQQQPGYGALGVVSCVDSAYDSVVSGEADVDTKKGREKIATTTANCAAAAACTAVGAGIASELCGQIGEIIAEVLIDVFNDLAGELGKFWGGGSDERKKRRKKLMAAAAENYANLQDVIWAQWFKSLENTAKLHKKLFGKTLSLEATMHLFAPYMKLTEIPGTAQLKPLYMGPPPKCYPGKGCLTTSSQAGYVFVAPGGTTGQSKCGQPPTTTIDVPGQGKRTITASGYTIPACLPDKFSAFFYAQDNLQKMIDYTETMIKAEIKVGLMLAEAKADQIAKIEMAERDAAAAARRKKLIADMKRRRALREQELERKNKWLTAIAQGSWGLLWRPR